MFTMIDYGIFKLLTRKEKNKKIKNLGRRNKK